MRKVFIIAEAGVNHNGSLALAKEMIDLASSAQCDAVKFQTFIPRLLVSQRAEKAAYQKRNMPEKMNENQLKMLENLALEVNEFSLLKRYCDKKGIIFLSTPFDYTSVNTLVKLVPAFKIASGDCANLAFLDFIASKGKPIILSTGMCTLGEVESAVNRILLTLKISNRSNFPNLTLLHCTTNYPCPYPEANLRAMVTLQNAFDLPVGYSDHTLGIEVSIAAVALGATMLEKHFTMDKSLEGPDHRASMSPDELKQWISAIRNIEASLGSGRKKPNASEKKIMQVARKSILANRDIPKGARISPSMLIEKRPATGISPDDKAKIIGLKVTRAINADEPVTWRHFK
jgi:N,N'-diacetyllegionaminate synthase